MEMYTARGPHVKAGEVDRRHPPDLLARFDYPVRESSR
jgi:hypothetical protein